MKQSSSPATVFFRTWLALAFVGGRVSRWWLFHLRWFPTAATSPQEFRRPAGRLGEDESGVSWQEKVLVIAERHPTLVGGVGADIKKMDFIPASAQEDPYTWVPDMLGFIQKHRLHWTAFSSHPAATSFWGALVKRALGGVSLN